MRVWDAEQGYEMADTQTEIPENNWSLMNCKLCRQKK